MIKYKLTCKDCSCQFDSWFASSKEFEKLKISKYLNCPSCNSLNIDKSLMAPSVINNKTGNKKTLVCILGQTRAQDITWNSFNKYVLNFLNADLALCVAEKKSSSNMYKNAKYIWSYKDSKDFSNHYENAQKILIKEKKLKKKPNWKKMLKVKDFWLAGVKGASKIKGSGGLLIYNKWYLLRQIQRLKLDKIYSRFIITRSDFVWSFYHPKLKNLDKKYIWIPNGEKYGGYTDRHAILSKSNYEDYLNILEPILLEPETLYKLMCKKKNWNHERYIKLHLKLKGYTGKIKFFPYIMYSTRNLKIKTIFAPGKYSAKHNYYIKYFKEYLYSLIMYYVIKDKKKYKNFLTLHFIYRLFKFLFKFKFFINFVFQNSKLNKKFDKKITLKMLDPKFIIRF